MDETEVTAPETGAEAPLSVRDTLAQALEASNKGELEVPETPGKPDLDKGVADDRPRGPDGKFIAKDAATETPETPETKPEKGAKAETPSAAAAPTPTATPGATATAVEAPQHWPQADRDLLAKASALPPEAQAWAKQMQDAWLRRDKEFEQGFQRKTQEVAPLLEVTNRVTPYLNHIGVKPEQAFDNIVQLDYALRTAPQEQKLALIQRLAQDYGVSFAGTPQTQQAPEQGQPDWVDPAVTALRKEFEQKVQAVQGENAQLRATWANAQRDRFLTEIADLENAKDAGGKPAHPHLAAVASEIGRLAAAERQAGRPIPSLKSLYETAIWAKPETRAQLLADQQAEQQRKITDETEAKRKAAEAEATAKAGKSRRAATPVTGAPRGGKPSEIASSKTVRQTLEEAHAANSGRV